MRTSVKILDIAEAKRYLAGVRSLADEAIRSSDARVVIGALRVLERQPAEIRRRFRDGVQACAA
jgi:hypothetical protein